MSEQSSLIYEKVQHAVSTILLQLSEQQSESGKIKEDISSAVGNLSVLNDDISSELLNLKENSEWKKFVIAFYGETNAGKSTVIEAIRLLFKEQSIIENQEKFKEIQKSSGLTQEAFNQVRQEIIDLEDKIFSIQQELKELDASYDSPLALAKADIVELESLLENIIKTRNFWQKMVAFILTPVEKKQVIEAKNKLLQLEQKIENERNQIQSVLTNIEQKKKQAEQEHHRLESEVSKLIQYADGQIIGDGQSDFTRDNTEYNFNVNGQEFTLIDVPGIEGDESIVKAPINKAVSKAHAVFYVTKTARPPQTHEGDINGNKKGTLEKIKEHLGAQTEVWSIYNHPITSPRMLKKPLIDEEFSAGLAAMDLKLKQELDDKYCESIVLSARPAFLALTECVVPGSKDAKDQEKLLNYFETRQKIYEMSGLQNFATQLYTNIIQDYKEKIKKSNHSKAYKVLEYSISQLDELYNGFVSKERQIQTEIHSSQSRIDVLLDQFSKELAMAGRKVVRVFRANVEYYMDEKIDTDISNDDFKRYLKQKMEEESQRLEDDFRVLIQKKSVEFEVEITRLIQRSSQHLNTISSMQDRTFKNSKFDISIKIDNGVQLLGLVSSGVGVVTGVFLFASNPVGWTLAFVGGALAVVGAIVGLSKSVWSAFSSNYKMSQQRKAVDKSIIQTKGSMEEGIKKMTESIASEMRKQMDTVKEEINKPVKQCAAIIHTLDKAKSGLATIAKDIYL